MKAEREKDLEMLRYCLAPAQEPELGTYERNAFKDMLSALKERPRWSLMPRQRAWVEEVWKRLQPIDVSKIPKGRPVATPEVLLKRPLRPPERKREPDE